VKDVAEFAGQKVEIVRKLQKGSAAEKQFHAKRSVSRRWSCVLRRCVSFIPLYVFFLTNRKRSNLEKLLQDLEGGNSQLTTIEKSEWDWQQDKREVGDEQELAQAAKDGYVAKTSFLLAAEERERQKLRQAQRLAAGHNR